MEAIFVHPWPWWGGGLAVGAFVTVYALVTGKPLGVSTGVGSACSVCFPRVPFFQARPYTDRWRLWFILGIPLGGLIGVALDGAPHWTIAMGSFDQVLTSSPAGKIGILFTGGVLAGFGARAADG